MALLELVTIGVVGGFVRKVTKNSREEKKRRNTPCNFTDGFSESEFEDMVFFASNSFKRITDISTEGPLVYGTVASQSQLSKWYFKVDFNDYGHLTGNYWISSDNDDSRIPKAFADKISSFIKSYPNIAEPVYNNSESVVRFFCRYCGEALRNTQAVFCPYCGSKLAENAEKCTHFNNCKTEHKGESVLKSAFREIGEAISDAKKELAEEIRKLPNEYK